MTIKAISPVSKLDSGSSKSLALALKTYEPGAKSIDGYVTAYAVFSSLLLIFNPSRSCGMPRESTRSTFNDSLFKPLAASKKRTSNFTRGSAIKPPSDGEVKLISGLSSSGNVRLTKKLKLVSAFSPARSTALT